MPPLRGRRRFGPRNDGGGMLLEQVCEAVGKGTGRLLEYAKEDTMRASPIGLYFAKLWYYEDLYPLIFAVSALQKVNVVKSEILSTKS